MSLKKLTILFAAFALITAPALADKDNKGLHLGGMAKEAKMEKIDARKAEAEAKKAAKKAEAEARKAAKEAEKAAKKAEAEAKKAAKKAEAEAKKAAAQAKKAAKGLKV